VQTLLVTEVHEVDKQRVFEGETVPFNDENEIGRSRGLEMQAGDSLSADSSRNQRSRNRFERFWRWLFRRAGDCLA
jgi:hypothetical protein